MVRCFVCEATWKQCPLCSGTGDVGAKRMSELLLSAQKNAESILKEKHRKEEEMVANRNIQVLVEETNNDSKQRKLSEWGIYA